MRQFPRLFVVLSCAALAGWLALTPSVAHPADLARPVLAYYYTWYDPGSFANALFQPPQPYNSDEQATMLRHISQAKSAGIDGFIVSWFGNGDRTDDNFGKLLDLAQSNGFSATIHFETTHFWNTDDVTAQLQAFYANHLNHPALVRYQGRPVIFFWAVSTYDNGTWSAIRNQVDPDHKAVWIADGDTFNVLSGDAWDGISPYAIAWSGNPAGQLPSWAAKARAVAPDKLWNPVVSPGCDDSGVRATTCQRDRAEGAYYQASWDGALASNPSWAVVVSTFNEWMESTQIEPSVQWGDQYLKITRQNADRYKASATALD
jgi:glycosyl hydrolase family 99